MNTPVLLALTVTVVLASSFAGAAERFVMPTHAAAQDAGAGNAGAPYRTIAFAMSQLRPGDRLIIEPGIYREALLFPERAWADADTVIEGRVGARVLLKGSDLVGDWTSRGNGRFEKVWQEETQQVFLDGKSLQQIAGNVFGGYPDKLRHPLQFPNMKPGWIWPGRREGGRDTMPVDSFFFDREEQKLHLRLAVDDLAGHAIEVSTRTYLMFGTNLSRITIRNIDFQHSNTSTSSRSGAVTLSGERLTLESIHVSEADSTGIDLSGSDITLKNSGANNCGQLGIKGHGRHMLFMANETSGNNTRSFNKWWEAGGAKFVGLGGLQDSVVSGHKAFANNGDGIWFDWKNRNNRIEGGLFAYNKGFGIHYEASAGAVITGNVVIGNGQRGIYLPQSSDSVIAFNLIARNTLQGIVIVDEGRRDPENQFDFRPRGNKVFGNVVAWNAQALFLPEELADNRSDANVYIGSPVQTRFSLGWPRKSQDRLSDWISRTGQDRNSRSLEDKIDPGFSRSIEEQRREPDLAWFKTFRVASKPLPLDPEWIKLLPAPGDGRPGPAL